MVGPIVYIQEKIDEFGLDFTGKVVLSEVADNEYQYSAVIPLLSGALKTIFINSENEKKNNDFEFFLRENFDENLYKIIDRDQLKNEDSRVDIVANVGGVRPIDKDLIDRISNGGIVLLMYDLWELRDSDIDLSYLASKGIQLIGTNENFRDYKIFDYFQDLVVKIVLEVGPITNGRYLIYSDDDFGIHASRAIQKFTNCAVKTCASAEEVVNLSDEYENLILCKYNETRPLIGPNGILNDVKSDINIFHIFGSVATGFRENVYPAKQGYPKKMSLTFSHLGSRPVLDLHFFSYLAGYFVITGQKSELVQLW